MYLQSSSEYLTEEGARLARLLPPGSVLVSCIGKLGKSSIAGRALAANQQINFLVPGARVDSAYLYYAVRTLRPELEAAASTTIVPIINKSSFASLTIPLPPLPEQRRIAAVLGERLAAVERARAAAAVAQLEAARALPAAYLRAVFESDEARGWPRRRLGEVCSVQLGKMLSPKSKTGVEPQPYLRNANVQWNRFDLSTVLRMDFADVERAKFLLRPGDLLVCEGGEPGRAAVWTGDIEPCYYQKALHRVRPLEDAIHPPFLLYRLWTGALRGEFLESHAQTTIAHLPAIRLRELIVQVPPIGKQERIAAALAEQMAGAERAREALEGQVEAIGRMPGALLKRAFAGEL